MVRGHGCDTRPLATTDGAGPAIDVHTRLHARQRALPRQHLIDNKAGHNPRRGSHGEAQLSRIKINDGQPVDASRSRATGGWCGVRPQPTDSARGERSRVDLGTGDHRGRRALVPVTTANSVTMRPTARVAVVMAATDSTPHALRNSRGVHEPRRQSWSTGPGAQRSSAVTGSDMTTHRPPTGSRTHPATKGILTGDYEPRDDGASAVAR